LMRWWGGRWTVMLLKGRLFRG